MLSSKTFLNEHEKQKEEWITLIQWVVIWSRECTSFSRVRFFVTPGTVVHPAPLSMGFSRQESWSGLPCPPPGNLLDPGIKPMSLMFPALAGRFFTISTTWEAYVYINEYYSAIVVVIQLPSHVRLFAITRTVAWQASPSLTISLNLPKFMSIESLMPSRHLILCHPLLLLPSVFPSIRVFSNESILHIRWPKYWSFSFSISPSNEYSGLIFFRIDWFDRLTVQGTLKSLLQNHSSKASILQLVFDQHGPQFLCD